MALKGHIQRVRHHGKDDPISIPKEVELKQLAQSNFIEDASKVAEIQTSKLMKATVYAKERISMADKAGQAALEYLMKRKHWLHATKNSDVCQHAMRLYREAFSACAKVLELDELAFQVDWFKSFWRRNYDALMIYSVYDNVMSNVDHVRDWLDALKAGSDRLEKKKKGILPIVDNVLSALNLDDSKEADQHESNLSSHSNGHDLLFLFGVDDEKVKSKLSSGRASSFFFRAEKRGEQELVDAIIDVLFFNAEERQILRNDPLVRLLIPNPPGAYNFTIISAMGIITEGKQGTELEAAFDRLKKTRDVDTIRADTGTARSFEYNAGKIEKAIEAAVQMKKPYGLLGYSQGCANILMTESYLLSGSPAQQRLLTTPSSKLVCRQLLFSAANGSMHGEASDAKAQKLIVMCEDDLKYHQGYFSRAFISSMLEAVNGVMDSASFQKFLGGAQSMLPEGVKAFWREAQHLPNVPTCVLRGVLEEHTTPESLEMTANLLTKQSGSALHDSQVHVYDAVGHPIYTKNRNGCILQACDMGGAIQRTHHWSPLDAEVEFIRTKRDVDQCSFECAKDRHVFPWVDVNARFGVIKYVAAVANSKTNTNTK